MRLAELREEMALKRTEGAGAGAVFSWYMQLRLIDQLLVNQNLTPVEAEEIRGGGVGARASFMNVTVDETKSVVAPAAAAAKATTPAPASGGGRAAVGSSFAALEDLEDKVLSRSQRKKKKKAEESELVLEENVEVDKLEQQLAKVHSIDTASQVARRHATKHPKLSSTHIEEMSVRQLKRALEERGETFDVAWVGRPDERKLLQKHAITLRSMCLDATSRSGRFFKDASKASDGADSNAIEKIEKPATGSKARKDALSEGEAAAAKAESEAGDKRRQIVKEVEEAKAEAEAADRRERKKKIEVAIAQQRLYKTQGNLDNYIERSLKHQQGYEGSSSAAQAAREPPIEQPGAYAAQAEPLESSSSWARAAAPLTADISLAEPATAAEEEEQLQAALHASREAASFETHDSFHGSPFSSLYASPEAAALDAVVGAAAESDVFAEPQRLDQVVEGIRTHDVAHDATHSARMKKMMASLKGRSSDVRALEAEMSRRVGETARTVRGRNEAMSIKSSPQLERDERERKLSAFEAKLAAGDHSLGLRGAADSAARPPSAPFVFNARQDGSAKESLANDVDDTSNILPRTRDQARVQSAALSAAISDADESARALLAARSAAKIRGRLRES